jgi:serine/threonine protein kinase
MIDLSDRPSLGPYVLTRELPPRGDCERWLALHEVEQTSHLLYRFPIRRDKLERRRFLEAVLACQQAANPHIMRIDQFSFATDGRPWIVATYPGDGGGIINLAQLARIKGGQFEPAEARRAVMQLLDASKALAGANVVHGPIDAQHVLVDRHGSLNVELFGLARALTGRADSIAQDLAEQVRSIVAIGYLLVTGLVAEEPLIPPSRLVKNLSPALDRWLLEGLDPARGYDTPAQAIAALDRDPATLPAPVVVTRGWSALRPRKTAARDDVSA